MVDAAYGVCAFGVNTYTLVQSITKRALIVVAVAVATALGAVKTK